MQWSFILTKGSNKQDLASLISSAGTVDSKTAELLSKKHNFPVTMYLDKKKKIYLCMLKYFIIEYNEQQMASSI